MCIQGKKHSVGCHSNALFLLGVPTAEPAQGAGPNTRTRCIQYTLVVAACTHVYMLSNMDLQQGQPTRDNPRAHARLGPYSSDRGHVMSDRDALLQLCKARKQRILFGHGGRAAGCSWCCRHTPGRHSGCIALGLERHFVKHLAENLIALLIDFIIVQDGIQTVVD